MISFEDKGIKCRPGLTRYATICPECNEKRAHHRNAQCLTVNDEPGNRWFHCNHCGWSGNLDVEDKYDGVRKVSKMPSIQRAFTMDATKYLKSRGISLSTAKKLQLYESSTRGFSLLCFPFYMNMTLVNVKFLNRKWKKGDNGPKWFQIPKKNGTKIIPFGMNLIKTRTDSGDRINKNYCIITEGEWDMATWVECGYNNVISVPQGAPSLKAKDYKKEFEWLQDKYVLSVFKEIDFFLLSADNDEPGIKLRNILGMILGKEKCRIVQYPVGYKDMNEVFVGNKNKNLPALGKEGVDGCFKNLASFPIKGVVKPSDVLDELDKLRNDGFEPGLGCGVPEIDRLFTVKRKLMMFLTGTPGSGKSVFSRWWVTKMIQHNDELDLKWALFTPENRPVSREYAKIAEVLTGKTIRKNQHNSMGEEMYRKAIRFIEKHFFIIAPNKLGFESFGGAIQEDRLNTLQSIQKYLSYLKKTENIFGYIIDAWNKIEHEQPKWQSETAFISQQLDHMLNFNDYYDLFGIIIVHPKKIETVGSNYKMPTLYDIKGSSAWKEKADIGVIAHRYKMKKIPPELLNGTEEDDEKYEVVKDAPTIIKTEKIRFEELGIESRIRMKMESYGRFYVEGKQAKEIDHMDAKIEKLFDDPDEKEEDLPF